MKKNLVTILSLAVGLVITGLIFSSCGGPKPLTVQEMGEVEVESLCVGKKYESSSKALRFSAIGESKDQMTAKKKAISEARAGLAATINTTVKSVTDNYVKTTNLGTRENITRVYESLLREVVNQNLYKAVVVCERMTVTKKGLYKYYVCLEQNSKDLIESMENALAINEAVKASYDYKKFRAVFDSEMSKFGNE